MNPFPHEAVGLLMDWYRSNARALPWREDRDPYRVLVSEIMLQQTRAETVKPYFRRFLDELPTVADLASADEQTILKLWEGLGYYSRVRNLQKAAQTVMREHGGVIPADFDQLLALPGVGRYTAGAVASIAFDIPVPAVDGNVLRVTARLLGDERDILQASVKKDIELAIAPHVPTPGAGDFTQSLIELGALVCLPGAEAKCAECPLRLLCTAAREGRVGELPVRGARPARRVEEMTVLVLRASAPGAEPRFAIRKRPARGLLGGLYEFPHLPGFSGEDAARAYVESLGLSCEGIRPLPDARHLFTHKEWQMRGYLADVAIDRSIDRSAATACPSDLLWVTPTDIRTTYTLPTALSVYRGVCLEDSSEDEGDKIKR